MENPARDGGGHELAMQLIREIHDLVAGGQLEDNAAIRLLLEAQAEILTRLEQVDGRIRELERRMLVLENRQEDTPSWLWLWEHNRKEAIFQAVIRFSIGLAFFWPFIIADMRQPLLDLIHNLLF